MLFFFFQAEDGIRDGRVTGVQTCALPISLSEAATACFGRTEWPSEIPVPQASIEFEVADVAAAAEELKAKGYRLIHEARTEPWKQITARLLSPEGLLVAVCYTPSFHDRSGASS